MAETPQQEAERRLLGSGLSFPLRQNASGYYATSAGKARVWESIEQIVMTDPMERPYRVRNGIPFGTRVRRLMFEDVEAAKAIAVPDIRRAIQTWEPRVELLSVAISEDTKAVIGTPTGEGASLVLTIRYRIRATGIEDFGVIRVTKEGRP